MIEIILIIAEKPSLARNIASSIGKMQKGEGFFCDKKYIVTWAFGHLFSLADIEDYAPNPDGKWSMKNIPCVPEKFEFRLKKAGNREPDAGVKRQFEIIKQLCNRPDIDTIVNAGDADREGEIIVRICVEKSEVSGKRFLRLWLPDQTPQTINKALSEMKESKEQ